MTIFEKLSKLENKTEQKWNELNVEGKNKLEKLTMGEILCVDSIMELNNPTVIELANKLNISQPNATYRINKLCNKNIIYKKTNEKDRRITNLYVNEEYVNILDELDKEYIKLTEKIEEKLKLKYTEEDIQKVCEMLDFIIDKMD